MADVHGDVLLYFDYIDYSACLLCNICQKVVRGRISHGPSTGGQNQLDQNWYPWWVERLNKSPDTGYKPTEVAKN